MTTRKLEGGPFATGIGSLPFEGIKEGMDRACELARSFLGEVPFEFELPRALPADSLVRRPFTTVLEPGDISEARLRSSIDEAGASDEEMPLSLSTFVSAILSWKERWVKFQVAGPSVLGDYVLDRSGKPLHDTPEGRALVLERVKKIIDQFCEITRKNGQGQTTPIVFLDEPGLPPDVGNSARAVEHARKQGAVVGVHDCGPDFRNALATRPDILSFDFSTFGPHVGETGDPLIEFCREGGAIAWGAVSTGPIARRFDPSVTAGAIRTAALRLMGGAEGAKALLARSLITPACGTALLEPRHAVSLHDRARAIAELLRMRRD